MAVRRRYQYQQLAFVAPVAAAVAGAQFISTEEVLFSAKTFLYQSIAEPVPFPPETVTVDKWLEPLSEPVRTRQLSVAQRQAATIGAPPIVSFSWFAPLPEPVRQKLSLPVAEQQSVAFTAPAPEVVNLDKWLFQLSEPIRYRQFTAAEQQAATGVVAPIVVTEDRWHQPWSEPVRQKSGLKSYLQQAVTFPRAVAARGADQWKPTQLSEPVRAKPYLNTALQQSFTTDPFPIPAAVVGVPAPLSEPIRSRPGLGPSLQQSTAFTALVPPVTVDEWFANLSEPVRLKSGLSVAAQQSYAANVLPIAAPAPVAVGDVLCSEASVFSSKTLLYQSIAEPPPQVAAEVITVDKWLEPFSEPVKVKPDFRVRPQVATAIGKQLFVGWHQSWSEPLRLKTGLGARYQQALQFDPFPRVFVTTVFAPLSEPVRQRPALKAQFQRFTELDPLPRPPAVTTVPGPLSEPIRQKRGLGAHEQQFLAFNPQPIGEFGSFGWFGSLSEPVRLKRGLPAGEQQTLVLNPQLPSVPFDWRAWLAEPVRVKRGLPVTEQQAATFVAFVPQPLASFDWFGTLSEPVRQKIGLRASLQQTFATDLTVPTVRLPSWFEAWSEPIRFKQGLSAKFQQTFATDWTVPAVRQPSWYQALSEPVRFRRFNTALQQTFTTDWKWGTPIPVTDLRLFWFDWLSEPVRFKPELKPALQQAFTTDWKWGIPVYQYSFAITETGDVGAFVFISNLPPSYPDIGIADIPFGDLTIVTVTSGPDMTEISVTASDGDETIVGII